MAQLEQLINDAWEKRTEFSPSKHPKEVKDAVDAMLVPVDF